jgi:methylmalonyl-CoA mutase
MSQAESLFSGFPATGHAEWKARVLEELKGADYSRIVWKTPDGFQIEPWYNRETALPAPDMRLDRRTNSWNICERIDLTDAAESAASLAAAIAGGANAVELRFDDPAQAGEEPLRALLGAIDPAALPLFFSGSFGDGSALLDRLLKLEGFAMNRGAILQEAAEANLADIARRPAGFRIMAVDTERFHRSGATIAQELAIALAGVSDLLSRCTDAGIAPELAASAVETVFFAGTSHFPELAKLRAFRAMWPVLLSAYGVPENACPQPVIFVRSSSRTMSALDPYTNILRLSTEAVSAILGGCDTLQLDSFDPAGSVPSSFSTRIARNIHHLLRKESGLDRVVDPAAGSFYIETMTASLCRSSWEIFREIEAAGGLREAEASGMVGAMVARAAETARIAINTRKRTIVGVNRYATPPSNETRSATAEGNPTGGHDFEQLRMRMIRHTARTGSVPRAVLWLHGDPAKCFRIAAFAEDFLRCGGFEVSPGIAMELETKSCRAILADEPDIVALCWAGENDLDSLPPILETMQELHKETVVVMASKPPEYADGFIRSGLDSFIHSGSDAFASLLSLQHKTGVL